MKSSPSFRVTLRKRNLIRRKRRLVHFPITLAFAVLTTAHIVAIFLFWAWQRRSARCC